MRLVLSLLAGAALFAGCNNVSDTTGSTPQRTTPATGPSGAGDSPAGTGQNSRGTYEANNTSAPSQPGTDAARP